MEQTGERTAVRSSESHRQSCVQTVNGEESHKKVTSRDFQLGDSLISSPTETAEQEQKMSDNHNDATDTVSHTEEVLHGKHTDHRRWQTKT